MPSFPLTCRQELTREVISLPQSTQCFPRATGAKPRHSGSRVCLSPCMAPQGCCSFPSIVCFQQGETRFPALSRYRLLWCTSRHPEGEAASATMQPRPHHSRSRSAARFRAGTSGCSRTGGSILLSLHSAGVRVVLRGSDSDPH